MSLTFYPACQRKVEDLSKQNTPPFFQGARDLEEPKDVSKFSTNRLFPEKQTEEMAALGLGERTGPELRKADGGEHWMRLSSPF